MSTLFLFVMVPRRLTEDGATQLTRRRRRQRWPVMPVVLPTPDPDPPRPWAARVALAGVGVALFVASTAVAFAPFGQFYLAWVGVVPLLLAIKATRGPWSAAAVGFAAGLGYFGVGLWYLWYIGFWPMVGSVVYLAPYLAVFAVLWRPLARRDATRGGVALGVVAAALLWTGLDWMRGTFLLSLPYIFLGHTQSPVLPMIQVADALGDYGVTFWVVLLNAALLAAWTHRRSIRTAVPTLAGVAAFLLLVGLYGGWRIAQTDPTPGPRVVLLQPNVPLLNTEPTDDAADFRWLAAATDRTLAKGAADLVVWPEAFLPSINPSARAAYRGYPDLRKTPLLPAIDAYLSERSGGGVALLVGGGFGDGWTRRTYDEDPRGGFDYPFPTDRRNSVYLYEDGEQSASRYDKTHLFPYGEYIPLRDWPVPFRWIYDLTLAFNPWGDDYALTPGTERTVFDLQTSGGTKYRAVTPICFEDIIPPQTRALVYEPDGTKRADVIVNVTNDGWFRLNQMEQHLQAALFRSVENRVPTARSVNTGGTAVIDSVGRIVAKLPSGVEGVLTASVPMDARSSPYGRVGSLFAVACAAGTGGWALWRVGGTVGRLARKPRRRMNRPSRPSAVLLLLLAVITLGVGCAPRSRADREALLLQAPPLPKVPPRRAVPLDESLAAAARQVVLAAAASERPGLRAHAAEAAEQLPPAEASATLSKLLDDPGPRVRFSAAMSAGRLRLADLRPKIEAVLDRPDANGRVAALYALHQFGDTRRTTELGEFAVAPDPTVRANAAVALGLLNEPTAVNVLRVMREDPDANVRLNAADAMWRLRDAEGLQALLAASISQYGDDQTIATLALSGPRDPRVVPVLEGKLVDEYPEISLAAARALGELNSDAGYPVATKYVESDDPRRRAMAAFALGEIGRLDAQPALAPLLKDKQSGVQLAAATAVLQLARVATAADVIASDGP